MDKSRLTFRRNASLIFLFGLIVALLWTFVIFKRFSVIHQLFDMDAFGAIGEHIYHGQEFSIGSGPTMRRAPLYPAIIALVFTIFGFDPTHRQQSYIPVFVLQCIFAGLACLIVYTMARQLFNEKVAIIAGLLCAIWPQCLRYLGVVDDGTTDLLLITLFAWLSLRYYNEPNVKNGLLAGAAIGLAALTKPVPFLFPYPLVALAWLHAKRGKKPFPAGGAIALIGATLVLCLPWIIRNYIVSRGQFTGISSNASGEFLRGYINAQSKYFLLRKKFQGNWDWEANTYEAGILRRFGLSFFTYKNGKIVGGMKESIQNEIAKEKAENIVAKNDVLHHPLIFLRKFIIQLFTFWYVVETPAKSILVGFLAILAIAGAIRGVLIARYNGVDVAPLVAVVLYFNIIYAAILAFARYSMPLYPVLITLAANGIAGKTKSGSDVKKTVSVDND
jgi:4-amino-4-deoxy-L-arabinose transferase-like glycosyltransferase